MEPSFPITDPTTESRPRPQPGTARAPADERRRNTPVRVRLGLQRRAQVNLRRHLARAVRRFVVLVIADLTSFYIMRALLRAVRDQAVLGEWLAAEVQAVVPAGILNGWQYAAALFVGLLVLGNYGPGDRRRDVKRLFLACALATSLPLWMTVWTRGLEVVALQYVLTTVLVWVGLVTERLLLDRAIARVEPARRAAVPTLFVGPAEQCHAEARGPAFSSAIENRIVGFVDVHIPPAPDALGHITEFARVLDESEAETVVVCGYLTDVRFHDVVDAALTAGCQVLSVPRAIEIAGVQPTLVWRRQQPLVELSAPTLRGGQLFVKRAMDIIGAAIGLVVLSPLFALIAILVKLDSPGPVWFRQQRVGRGGRRFKIAKFRTMDFDAEQRREELIERSIYSDRRLFKIPDDPRITTLGRWLRQTSLDELPQLLNVLKGDMSLVGPRPPLPSEVELYEAHHYARFDVKPGITGPWQVAGRNEIKDFERVVGLETQYIREWSIWGDLLVLFRTVGVVVRMKGAH
ncbi:MAG TPA: sugar transferase [Gemmatimonadales bacterium]|nr:sugar transferase [Gemmatimonadales bacterium]